MLTDLRLVIRHRIALPGTVEIPLRALRSVAVRVQSDGTGDVALTVRAGVGIGYCKLWPHVRGLSLSRPVPMLRGLEDAALLSASLARRLDAPLPLPSSQDVNADAVAGATAAEPLAGEGGRPDLFQATLATLVGTARRSHDPADIGAYPGDEPVRHRNPDRHAGFRSRRRDLVSRTLATEAVRSRTASVPPAFTVSTAL